MLQTKVVSWARKKTGIAVRAEEDEEEKEIVEVAACGCVSPYRIEVAAKAREKKREQRGGEQEGRGGEDQEEKEEILQGAINLRR